MRRYLIKRFLRSLLSIFIVMTIVFTLVYSVVPRDRVFFSDVNIEKLQKRPDDYLNYKYIQWEKLGYLKYETIQDYCRGLYGDANGEYVLTVKSLQMNKPVRILQKRILPILPLV